MKILWLTDFGGEADLPVFPADICCKLVSSISEALLNLTEERDAITAAVVRLPMDEEEAFFVLESLQKVRPQLPVMFVREGGLAAEAVQLVKLGAHHYFDAMPDTAGWQNIMAGLIPIERKPSVNGWRHNFIGNSPAMENVAEMIQLIAGRRSTVLILGETGTGKEVVARAIHQLSPRGHRQMVAVNCAAIPDELLEAELFGHVKGAFTGATNARLGRFEQAHCGTLFLDEVGDMPLDLQAKLLRVLQEREFQRVGSSETVRVDVRVIAATNVDLMDRVKSGKFREDLYYRLNVVPIRVPALRERLEDIPSLAHHFAKKVCDHERLASKTIVPETMIRLAQLAWPGNVRQLENAVEMAVVMSGSRTTLLPADFANIEPTAPGPKIVLNEQQLLSLPDEGIDFERVIGRIELNLLEQALTRAKGNKKIAADMLGLKRTTLAAKLKSLDLLVCQ